MNTVFVGGSRHVSRLPVLAKERLDNIVSSGFHVIVGDANGADKAVQRYLMDNHYANVIVYCSGDNPRNNLAKWKTNCVKTSKSLKGYDFFAAKDRAMARDADFGLMIWDGKSVGTVLNVLRLVRANKKAVLLNVHDKGTTTFKAPGDWDQFISHFDSAFRNDLQKRATSDEWTPPPVARQTTFLDTLEPTGDTQQSSPTSGKTDDEIAAEINAALATGDPTSAVDALGNAARRRGMSQVAKDAGLARESLYRSLGAGGNPEFTTVLKVIASMGLRLMVSKASDKARNERS